MLFHDRSEAGEQLARRLMDLAARSALVLALPRGGVPVARPVADRLGAELDLLLVRKLGVPGHEELAMGAIALGGAIVANHDVIDKLHIPATVIEAVAARETWELERRAVLYRGSVAPPRIEGRVVIVVDDGLATGSTARAGLEAVRSLKPDTLVLAIPVAPSGTLEALRGAADRIECLATPEPFYAVGLWYRDFSQVSDDEVRALLTRSPRPASGHAEAR